MDNERPPVPPLPVLVVGVAAVSTGSIFARMAGSPALVTAAYRVGLAMVILGPVAIGRVHGELMRLSRRQVALAVCSGFFLALHFAVWISSLDYTSVANSTVLVNTIPLWVGLLTPLITGERVHPRTKIAIVLSVIGGAVIGAGDFHLGVRTLAGDGMAVAGGICAAVYLLLGRSLRQHLSLTAYIFICYGSAAVFLWIAVLAGRYPVTGFDTGTWAALWGLAVVSQLIGHSSFNWAVRWFSSATVAVTLLGEPILASIMAYYLFGERLGVVKILGGCLILGAIYLSASVEGRQGPGAGLSPDAGPPGQRLNELGSIPESAILREFKADGRLEPEE